MFLFLDNFFVGVDANSIVLSCSSLSDFMLNPVDPEVDEVLNN